MQYMHYVDITIYPAYCLIWRNAAQTSDLTLMLLSRLQSRWESDSRPKPGVTEQWMILNDDDDDQSDKQAETRTDKVELILNDSNNYNKVIPGRNPEWLSSDNPEW